jgi:hypothetical protein
MLINDDNNEKFNSGYENNNYNIYVNNNNNNKNSFSPKKKSHLSLQNVLSPVKKNHNRSVSKSYESGKVYTKSSDPTIKPIKMSPFNNNSKKNENAFSKKK